MLFDTHAHLDNQQLTHEVAAVIDRARSASVTQITAVGTDLATSRRCVEIAEAYEGVYASVGVHPTVCHEPHHAEDWPAICEMASLEHVVAVGETGLDRHWDESTIDVQKHWLQKHVDLSFAKGKPLVIHMRDCETEIVDTLESMAIDGQILGIMHSYTGSIESANRCMAMGMYISFAGMVTFKKSDDLRGVAAQIPHDRVLIETDSPYLSPHPRRSQRPNEPALLVHTANVLGDVLNVSPEELAAITTANAMRVFGLSEQKLNA